MTLMATISSVGKIMDTCDFVFGFIDLREVPLSENIRIVINIIIYFFRLSSFFLIHDSFMLSEYL